MDITIQFAGPPKKGVVQNYSEAVGLSKEPVWCKNLIRLLRLEMRAAGSNHG